MLLLLLNKYSRIICPLKYSISIIGGGDHEHPEVLQCVIHGVLSAGPHWKQCFVGHLVIKMCNMLAYSSREKSSIMEG